MSHSRKTLTLFEAHRMLKEHAQKPVSEAYSRFVEEVQHADWMRTRADTDEDEKKPEHESAVRHLISLLPAYRYDEVNKKILREPRGPRG